MQRPFRDEAQRGVQIEIGRLELTTPHQFAVVINDDPAVLERTGSSGSQRLQDAADMDVRQPAGFGDVSLGHVQAKGVTGPFAGGRQARASLSEEMAYAARRIEAAEAEDPLTMHCRVQEGREPEFPRQL